MLTISEGAKLRTDRYLEKTSFPEEEATAAVRETSTVYLPRLSLCNLSSSAGSRGFSMRLSRRFTSLPLTSIFLWPLLTTTLTTADTALPGRKKNSFATELLNSLVPPHCVTRKSLNIQSWKETGKPIATSIRCTIR